MPLHTVSMITDSGGGVPSSSMTRPLRNIGVGIEVGWVVVVGMVVELVRVPVVDVIPVPPMLPVPPVLPVLPVLPVDGAVVAPPLVCAQTAAIDKADTAANAIALTQIFEAIPPPLPGPIMPPKSSP